MNNYGATLLQKRRTVIIFCLLFIILAASGLPSLKFSSDYRIFFSPQNPQLQAFNEFQDRFGSQDNIMIAIESVDGNIFQKNELSVIRDYTELAWQTPHSKRVDSLTNYQNTESIDDDLIVSPLVKKDSKLTPEEIASIRHTALNEQELVGRLVSSQGHVAAINITMNLPPNAGAEEAEAMAFARDLAQRIEKENPQLNTYLSGQTPLNAAFIESIIHDGVTLMPLMFLMIIVSTYGFLRSWAGTIGAVLVVSLSVITAFGFGGHLGILQSSMTGAAPVVILTLAIADSIHLLSTFFHELRHNKSREEAMRESIRINMQPIFLTSFTTVIGFLSLNFSEIPPIRDLGNTVALGVVAAFIFSIVGLPVFMMLIPMKTENTQRDIKNDIMDKLHHIVIKHYRGIIVFFAIIIPAFSVFIPRIDFNDLFAEYFNDSIEFRRDNDFILENLTGVMALHYSVEAMPGSEIVDPDYLKQLEAFGDWFKQQPATLHVDSLATLVKRLNKVLHGNDPSHYTIPDNADEAAQYLFFYELSLPYGLDLKNKMDVHKINSRFTITIKNTKSKDLIALDERAMNWLSMNAPDLKIASSVGPSIMFAQISERNLASMVYGLITAILLITVALMISLKSILLGLLSLIPNVAPTLLAYGAWGLWIGELGMTGAVMSVVGLGIIVDNTVHFMSKYLRARRERNETAEEAIHYAFNTVGIALGVTSVVLITGFLVLILSAFELNAILGKLVALDLFFSLIITYFLLPSLLLLLAKKKDA
ncbi:MAG: MMPL family transporter [Pseudomonadales bacterium]|nr:MMPL family transporter [Pseudomonadales bacterium]